MKPGAGTGVRRGLLGVGVALLAATSVWAAVNREALARACLQTWEGATTKLAHLNQPFGSGTTVESRNPVLGVVAPFTLTERSGRPVGNADLLGGYWVASFIFTRCATSCPMATAEMAKLQTALPEEVRLVSFTVDPDHDSPAVLSAYAEGAGADSERWLFLTGDKDVVYRSIREGFHLAVEANDGAPEGWEVTHSPRLALVDPQGRIRGYYETTDAADLSRLVADVNRLRGKPAQAG